jgi:hypothetical protein
MPNLDHLLATGFTAAQDFKSPLSVVRQQTPDRDRGQHGAGLLRQLQGLAVDAGRLKDARAEAGVDPNQGFAITLEIAADSTLDPGAKLEWKRDGIEVLNVTHQGAVDVITVFVPDGKLSAFEKRVREYLEQDGKPPKNGAPPRPKNASLINAISTFRRAAFTELWTDTALIPAAEDERHFTVWLRLSGASGSEIADRFRQAAEPLGIVVEPGHLSFPGRVIIAARATRAQLERSLVLLDLVAEIRSAAPSAHFFLADLKPFEQVAWVQNLAGRIAAPGHVDVPFITLLDTGVNRAHPLLAPLIGEDDLHAIGPEWTATDHVGHGSGMAGIALHGDLRGPLASQDEYVLNHRLESVKILPDNGNNPRRLYGWTANEAIRLVETNAAARTRTFAMMTTAVGATAGMPSEWSATIDRLAFGLSGDSLNQLDLPVVDGVKPLLRPRLFVLSAGNIPWQNWHDYPTGNDLETIEDPAQSWNALTVGAFTEQVQYDKGTWPGLHLLAPSGALAPASRTSVNWSRSWPHKPDVVAEGGNACLDGGVATPAAVVVGPEDLRVLTTSHDPITHLVAETGDTSAATAEVARLCAHLQHRYPDYWPETIRALVVHGAEYTPAMRQCLSLQPTTQERETLVGRYGYGRVSLNSSINSNSNRPVIVLQETIVPYLRNGNSRTLGQLNLHELPWPTAQLEALGEASVALKVTLSYFIQPNPSRRGWQSKFRYQNFALRFAVRASAEDTERFHQRINKVSRDDMGDDRESSMPDPDSQDWLLRARLRSRGSLHSDTWFGSAAALGNKSEIAVFPVGGWWKEVGAQLEEDVEMRYALTVSLEVINNADVDIYSPIAAEIANTVVAVVPIP